MIRSLIYIVIFALGTLAGSLFPSFSIQYQNALHARYEQVFTDLAPFQEIADRYHGGSLAALIQYHLNSEDPTFHDEGVAIQSMALSRAQLAESGGAMEASFFDQALHFFIEGDPELVGATWDNFTPAFVTTRAALTFALSVGLILSVIFFLSSHMVRMWVRRNA
jgi:hypothetical protein